MTNANDSPQPSRFTRALPYLVLLATGGAFFAFLLLRGLDLGFTHDSLRIMYFYQRDGIAETTRWVLDYDSRHLFSGLQFALLQTLFPYQSWVWYAAAFALQIASGVLLYALWMTVLGGRWRGWGLAGALLFMFHAGQRVTFFQVTVWFMFAALAAALLSLIFYARYVAGGRRHRLWRDVSLALYAFGVLSYESTALWPLAFPLIAWLVEGERARPGRAGWWAQIAADAWLYPVIAGVYWVLVRFYHPPSWWVTAGLGESAVNLLQAVLNELTPLSLLREFAPAFAGLWLPLTLGLLAEVGVVLFLLWNPPPAGRDNRNYAADQRDTRALFGGLALAAWLGVLALAPAAFSDNVTMSRVVHAGTAGAALWLVGLIVLGAQLVKRARLPLPGALRRAAAAFLCAALIAPGMSALLIERDTVAERTATREASLDAIQAALPASAIDADDPPYLLIIPDDDPLALGFDAQDLRFPLFFDLRYGVNDLDADMLYPAESIAADQWPEPGTDPLAYSGQVLIVTEAGVVSPLVPGEIIPAARLVLIGLEGGAARILPAIAQAEVSAYNVEWRRASPLRTSPRYLPE